MAAVLSVINSMESNTCSPEERRFLDAFQVNGLPVGPEGRAGERFRLRKTPMPTYTLIPDPRISGSLRRELGKFAPVDAVVEKFGASPSLFNNGHDWYFLDEAGTYYSLSVRRGMFYIGAVVDSVYEFETWLRSLFK